MDSAQDVGASVPDQALAVPVEPASSLAPSGFDPSRAWRTDTPPFDRRPIYQFVLLEGYQEHSGRTWARKFAGTAMIDRSPGNRFGYRSSDIDRIQTDGDMIVVERISGWVPASWPRWDWFLSDSDGNPKGGDSEAAPSQSDDSAGRATASPVSSSALSDTEGR